MCVCMVCFVCIHPSFFAAIHSLEVLLTKRNLEQWRQLFKEPPKPPPDSDSDSSDDDMGLIRGKRGGFQSGLRKALRMPKLRRPKPLFFFDQQKKEVIWLLCVFYVSVYQRFGWGEMRMEGWMEGGREGGKEGEGGWEREGGRKGGEGGRREGGRVERRGARMGKGGREEGWRGRGREDGGGREGGWGGRGRQAEK